MTNPPILVITGLGGYFILNFLQKSGYTNIIKYICTDKKCIISTVDYKIRTYYNSKSIFMRKIGLTETEIPHDKI